MSLPVIILVGPQMGENIGACARAMLNCGLDELRIVNPRDGWPNDRANTMSAGALEKMPPVKVYTSTADAVADCHYVYATTARPRDMVKPVVTARQAAEDIRARQATDQRCAFLFGCERTGLENDDIALAHAIITIPVNPDFSSLNLGQGVLLCAYERYQAQKHAAAPVNPDNMPAPHAELDNLMIRLENELADGSFFRTKELRPTVMRNIRNLFARTQITSQEINTFHGIIAALTGRKQK
jgi:tRNA/rRNA methyltransferase